MLHWISDIFIIGAKLGLVSRQADSQIANSKRQRMMYVFLNTKHKFVSGII